MTSSTASPSVLTSVGHLDFPSFRYCLCILCPCPPPLHCTNSCGYVGPSLECFQHFSSPRSFSSRLSTSGRKRLLLCVCYVGTRVLLFMNSKSSVTPRAMLHLHDASSALSPWKKKIKINHFNSLFKFRVSKVKSQIPRTTVVYRGIYLTLSINKILDIFIKLK